MMLKAGVNPQGLRPELLLAIIIAQTIWNDHTSAELVITSLLEGRHSNMSLHYAGCAVDLRTHTLTDAEIAKVAKDLSIALGDHYDVVIEPTHLHVEYQPRHPT